MELQNPYFLLGKDTHGSEALPMYPNDKPIKGAGPQQTATGTSTVVIFGKNSRGDYFKHVEPLTLFSWLRPKSEVALQTIVHLLTRE